MYNRDSVLLYHGGERPGKLQIALTKPCANQADLANAYTPGVAMVCEEIDSNVDSSFDYTSRGNLVAVISNGTAILGLGDLGPEASKPVMEGKAVLFKKFADVDVFDLEVREKDPRRLIEIIRSLEPTFGGINLEDIKAPECFEIENALIESLSIPVFHDDQHGTAIITAAALLNALELQGKRIEDVRITVSGAGAAAIACCDLFLELGARRGNILLVDSKGVVRMDRTDLTSYKRMYAQNTHLQTLRDALGGCDVFLGVSQKDVVSGDDLQVMSAKPIIFALSNPDPEVPYAVARSARPDAIVATGRSDNPNQVNNVLGFPFIFRGALDVRASRITVEMKIAAAKALAALARRPVPQNVKDAYGGKDLAYGADYIIPSPFDNRVLFEVSPAVARAAMESGVARKPIRDFAVYRQQLAKRLGVPLSE